MTKITYFMAKLYHAQRRAQDRAQAPCKKQGFWL